jgi:formate hydrogenlyase transcriptional activator
MNAESIDAGLNLAAAQAAQKELQRQNERLQLLLNLTSRITSNLGLRELLREISANIRAVMHCEGVGVYLADSASESFTLLAFDFPDGKAYYDDLKLCPPENDPLKRAFDTLKPVIVSTDDLHDVHPAGYELLVASGIKNHSFVPLSTHDRALGVLCVAHTTEAVFTPEDIEFLSRASGQIAIALEMPWLTAKFPN